MGRGQSNGKRSLALPDEQEEKLVKEKKAKFNKGRRYDSLDSFRWVSKDVLFSLNFLYGLRESGSQLNEVSSNLTKHAFYNESQDKNLVFSPLSLHVVLSLVAACFNDPIRASILSLFSSSSIDDLTELLSAFNTVVLADGSSSGGPHLASANGVLVDQSLRIEQGFPEVVKDYKATLKKVEFPNKYEEARREVNLWVEKKTRSLIKELLPPGSMTSKTALILVNAIYFKGAWMKKFDASNTKHNEFHLLNGKSVRIPFMTSRNKQLISAYDGFKVLRLPYRGAKSVQDNRSFSMCFFLPDAKDGLPILVDKLASEPKFMENHPADSEVGVGKFLIPKFKLSFDFEASELLKGLGLVLPRKSKIFHKSCIEVNEEGTEAVAATAFVVRRSCGRQPKHMDFVADHPFLFFIKEDNTGVVLFTGIVLDPAAS